MSGNKPVDCHSSGYSAGSVSKDDHSSSSEQQVERDQPQPHHLLKGAGNGQTSGQCKEGWLYSHGHCLLDTGLGSGSEAEVICRRHGAEEARGICVKQSPALSGSLQAASLKEEVEEQEEELEQGTPLSSASGSDFVCPSGWTRYDEFCFFRPSSISRVCGLLGANYIFNYCVTRVPQSLPTDFMHAVKRLEGSDYDMHRDTRLCCCGGHMGFCK